MVKRKRTELKAFKYAAVMKQYADVFAPSVATSERGVKKREEQFRTVRAKIQEAIPPIILRQLFMTAYSLTRKGVTSRAAVQEVLRSKYPHYRQYIDPFLDAYFS